MRRIPISVNSLTLEQYVKFKEIETAETDNVVMATRLLSLLTGLTEEQLDDLPIWKTEHLFKQIGNLRSTNPNRRVKRTLWIKGKRYEVCKSEKHLNTNQLTIADTLQVDSLKHLHLLAATIYMRYPLFGKKRFDSKTFTDLAEEMKKQKVGKVLGAVFFYSNRLKLTKLKIQDYSQKAMTEIEKRMVEVEHILEELRIDTGGTMSSILSQVAIHSKKMN